VIFQETKIPGVVEIRIEPRCDERGFFARSWCRREFERNGLNPALAQCNISFNERKGTLRGMHFNAAPDAEAKVVRCTKGRLYDVAIDLRPGSPTFKQWVAVVLSAEERNMLYVPEGCAHGFLTMEDQTEVFYQMSDFYKPDVARGVRWDDPAFRICWPASVAVISGKDLSYPDFESDDAAERTE
jgi:dTDP-4-dehydrorhamnose 3,5-epimerase